MTDAKAPLFTPVLVASCLILLVGFGIRATFGLFQIPIAEEFGWPRAYFSFAIAIQNLAWGFGQPIFGAIAERFGDRAPSCSARSATRSGWCCRPTRPRRGATRS